MNAKHILGTVTIVVIIGGTIYAIKKSKDAKKSEGDEISLAEAKAIVAEKNFDKSYSEHFGDNVKFGARFDGDTLTSVSAYTKPEASVHHFVDSDKIITHVTARPYAEEPFEEEDGELEDEDETLYDAEIIESTAPRPLIETMTEEDRVLRHEPSSIDALHQFKKMELAEWSPNEDSYQILARLFEFPFQPHNDGDDMLRTALIDYRVQFFGFSSKWAKQVSFADVILHYARAAEFNQGESVKYWVEYFLDFNDLWYQYSSNTLDEAIRALNSHAYFNEERKTFGLFGLTQQSMDQAIRIANMNIDSSVTYEIEFNEFLKSCI